MGIHRVSQGPNTDYKEQIFGSNSGFLTADATTMLVVTGGNAVNGTELHIYAGDNIESGSASYKMKLKNLYVTVANAAAKINVLEFLSFSVSAAYTGTTTVNTETWTRTGGLAMNLVNGDKVIVTALTNSTGPLTTEVYYVKGVSGSDFKLCRLTDLVTDVALGGTDGTFSIKKITQTSITKKFISMAAITNDALPIPLEGPAVGCDQHLSVRVKSESGQTEAISFVLGLFTYKA